MFFKILALTFFCVTIIRAEDFEPTADHLKLLWSLVPFENETQPDFAAILSKMTQEEKNKVKEFIEQMVPAERGEFVLTAMQRAQIRDLAMQLTQEKEKSCEEN